MCKSHLSLQDKSRSERQPHRPRATDLRLILFLLFSICSRLDALDPNAYEAFKASRNLQDVVERVLRNQQDAEKTPGVKRTLSVQASLMTPVQPMLVMLAPL